ncbi:MAG: hypothetical protein QM780_02935 [Hyphomicrobium sp.]|uniref:hypothetical protein n=1 Tax=Hyphomicrobium sp. TaxID=82 RepID=UPI0039E49C8C
MSNEFGRRRWKGSEEAVPAAKPAITGSNTWMILLLLLAPLIIGALYFPVSNYIARRAEENSRLKIQAAIAEASRLQELALQARIASVKETAAGMLKNPESARFREVTIDRKTRAVCGYINGTNSYGGYAGEMKFVGDKEMVYLIKPNDPENQAGIAAYNINCN